MCIRGQCARFLRHGSSCNSRLAYFRRCRETLSTSFPAAPKHVARHLSSSGGVSQRVEIKDSSEELEHHAMTTGQDRQKLVVGVIGGMSPASTVVYYQELNRLVRCRLGGNSSADIILRSVNFAAIEELQQNGRWDDSGIVLGRIAQELQKNGAGLVILATNTMHKVAPAITASLTIPFLHIADATATAIKAAGFNRPGIIATRYTMEQDFYLGRFRDYGLDPVVPIGPDRTYCHRIIFEELCKDLVRDDSRTAFEQIAERLVVDGGIDCLVLGCTEVGLLLNSGNVSVPVFDTLLLHCQAAIEKAFSG